MAKTAGREFVLKKNSTAIAGCRQTGLSVDMQPIDITDNDSDGIRDLLAGAVSSQSLSIEISGLEEGQVLRDIALTPATDRLLTDMTLDFANGDSLGGNFFLSAYSETGAHDGASEFSATLLSSGSWTLTQAA